MLQFMNNIDTFTAGKIDQIYNNNNVLNQAKFPYEHTSKQLI